jgi:hypothetical protein
MIGIEAFAIAAVWLAAFFLAARSRHAKWAVLGVLAIPILVIPLLHPAFRISGHHAYFHWSIAYGLLNGHLPPEDPLMAGQPLRYPWLYHLAAAGLTKALQIAPTNIFYALNVAVFAGSTAVAWSIGRRLSDNPMTPALAALLSTTGMAPLHGGPWRQALTHLPKIDLDPRISSLHKYLEPSGNPLGILVFLAFLLVLLRASRSERISLWNLGGLAALTLAAALLYPPTILSVVGGTGVWLAVRLIGGKKAVWIPMMQIAAAVSAGCLLSLPYLLTMRSPNGPSFVVTLRPGLVAANVISVAAAVGLPFALLLWERRRSAVATRSPEWWLIASFAVFSLGMAIFTKWYNAGQYKFLLSGCIAVALLTAAPLAAFLAAKPLPALLACLLFAIPSTTYMATFSNHWPVVDQLEDRGMALHHADPDEDEIQTWVREKTPIDSVVVDTALTAPVLAQRPLFIGTDLRTEAFGKNDGWNLLAQQFLEQGGQDPAEIARRKATATALLTGSGPSDVARELTEARSACPARPLVIICRDARARHRLDTCLLLRLSLANSRGSVYVTTD